MRIMYDAVTAANIPVDAQIVAGYVGGNSYTWSPADWARFPRAQGHHRHARELRRQMPRRGAV